MTVTAEHEAPRPDSTEAGFADAVTIAFGDTAQRTYGLARVGVSDEGASGLAILFDGPETIAANAEGGQPAADTWEAMPAGGVRHAVLEPLRAWSVAFDDGDGNGFDLRLTATSAPAETDADGEAARVGGMHGYEQLCAVEGVVRIGGRDRAVRCLGQRGHGWGAPDWDRIELARTVSAWLGDGNGALLTGIRPTGAAPDIEATTAYVVTEGAPRPVAIPYLSTEYDGEGRQRRAGLELWPDPEKWPVRGAGDLICGSSLDLGRLRYDCAFFGWRMEGRTGVGRYDILRRVV
ncbi:MAG: hypothetical protein JHC95_21025 [Solirubrobacteraceae bacterium]|nr:hypothetical protein [Solirubrobacteraceae bacterium]